MCIDQAGEALRDAEDFAVASPADDEDGDGDGRDEDEDDEDGAPRAPRLSEHTRLDSIRP